MNINLKLTVPVINKDGSEKELKIDKTGENVHNSEES